MSITLEHPDTQERATKVEDCRHIRDAHPEGVACPPGHPPRLAHGRDGSRPLFSGLDLLCRDLRKIVLALSASTSPQPWTEAGALSSLSSRAMLTKYGDSSSLYFGQLCSLDSCDGRTGGRARSDWRSNDMHIVTGLFRLHCRFPCSWRSHPYDGRMPALGGDRKSSRGNSWDVMQAIGIALHGGPKNPAGAAPGSSRSHSVPKYGHSSRTGSGHGRTSETSARRTDSCKRMACEG